MENVVNLNCVDKQNHNQYALTPLKVLTTFEHYGLNIFYKIQNVNVSLSAVLKYI